MKRILGFVLALSMIIAMVPAVAADNTTGLTLKYDISSVMRAQSMSSSNYATKPLTLINEETTKGFFSFFGTVADMIYGNNMKYRAYGLEFYKSVAPAFELYIPRAGKYTMNVYANRGGDGRVVNVYMTKNAASIDAVNKIGEYDCNKTADDTAFGDEKYVLQTVVNGSADAVINITEPGSYVFTFHASNMWGTLGGIELVDVSASSAPVLMSAKLGDVTDGTAEVISGYMSDGAAVNDFSGATITYASSNTSVAKIDASTGVITNVGEGETEITATVTLSGGTAKASAKYTVRDGVKIKYDIYKVMNAQGLKTASDAQPITLINYNTTNGFFSFFGTVADMIYGNNMKYRAYGLEFYKSVAPAFELYIPRAGKYTMNVYANRGGDGRVVNVYMTKNAASIDAVNKIGEYDCNKTADDTAFGDEKYVLQTVVNGSADAVINITEPGSYVFTFHASNGWGTLGGIELIDGLGTKTVPIISSLTETEGTVKAEAKLMSDGSDADGVTYSYAVADDDAEKASVNATSGVVTGLADGTATIIATATKNGISSSKSIEVSVTAPKEDEDLKAAFNVTETPINDYIAPTVTTITINGVTDVEPVLQADGSYRIEAPATNAAGKAFLYWAKAMSANEKIVSLSNIVYYVPEEDGRNILAAVYEGDVNLNAPKCYNANGQYLPDAKPIAADLPSMAGYGTATEWVQYKDTNIYVAQYGEKIQPDNVTVTVDGTPKNVPYGTSITCKADSAKANFKCWTKSDINGKTEIVSVEKNYTFKAWEDCTVTAVYVEHTPLNTAMKIIIDSFTAGNETGVMAEFIGFGNNVVEKGIMFNNERIAMTTVGNQFSVIADENGTYKGYVIVDNGDDGYTLITDGLYTKSN